MTPVEIITLVSLLKDLFHGPLQTQAAKPLEVVVPKRKAKKPKSSLAK
jgi:hypothetical protein